MRMSRVVKLFEGVLADVRDSGDLLGPKFGFAGLSSILHYGRGERIVADHFSLIRTASCSCSLNVISPDGHVLAREILAAAGPGHRNDLFT
jgi:hypothetical protein